MKSNALSLGLFLLLTATVQAATLTVTTTADSGAGSLRQAILDANASPGQDNIAFNIAGSGVQTIAPLTALPTITDSLIIDGYTQPGASANNLVIGDNAVLLIQLAGTSASGATGLTFTGGTTGSSVRGLVINRFSLGITLSGASNMTIEGNFFGTNAAGTAALPNTSYGLFILSGAQNNTIGGATPAKRNIISGNNSAGITLGNTDTTGNVIQNNYIGTNASGTAALSNFQGISFNSGVNCSITGNLISGNTGGTFATGIAISNFSSGNTVTANLIGTKADGTTALPNANGILLYDGFSGGTTTTTIGTISAPNTIAFNQNAGVALFVNLSQPSTRNSILYNSIFGNGGLGIDLGKDGATLNDIGDGDSGSNGLQNYPVLSSAQFNGTSVTVQGSLSSKPSSTYTLQFFQTPACDPSEYGEGQTFLGETMVTTDAAGMAPFSVTFTGTSGGVVTATATDSLGNTSEFSQCRAIAIAATPQITIRDAAVTEGNAGTTTMTFQVLLSSASAATVTVAYQTADGTATAGVDYTAANGTVTFAAGETVKTIDVLVNGDVASEGDETLFVNLSAPTNATIADAQGVGTIKDDDSLPALSIGDVSTAEGDSGTTNFDFTVTLAPAGTFPVTVNYTTADGTAVAGADYQAVSGTLTFAPGQATKTISVPVIGDLTREPDKTFFVNLTNPGSASISDGQGVGTIVNDDPIPTVTINDPTVTEGNSGTKNMNFVITLSNPSSSTISVFFNLTDGTATVGSDYQTNSGSFTVLPGSTTASLSVGIIGDTNVEPDETFFCNLTSATGATIVDNQGVGTILNDDGLALPGISISDVSSAEGNVGTTNFNFTVNLTAASASTVTVDFVTADGTASSGSDYTATSGTLTFTPGQTSKSIAVPIFGDTTVEGNETFVVNLTNPTNASLLNTQGHGTILNDDGLGTPNISISDITVTEGNSGTTSAVFTISLSSTTGSTVTVNWATANGTATAPSDYTASSGTVTFPPNSTPSQTISVPVIGDNVNEPDETFVVNLSGATNGVIVKSQGTGTITNDDLLTRGDANGDSVVSVSDIFYLINSLFTGGPAPIGSGDANGDNTVSVSDIFYLINYLFAGGPPPP